MVKAKNPSRKVAILVRVSPAVHRVLKKEAAKDGRSLQYICDRILNEAAEAVLNKILGEIQPNAD